MSEKLDLLSIDPPGSPNITLTSSDNLKKQAGGRKRRRKTRKVKKSRKHRKYRGGKKSKKRPRPVFIEGYCRRARKRTRSRK